MVSIAIDVFPVVLLPIMASLWPFPIGSNPSIDINPVSRGWLTGLRESIVDIW